MCVLIIDLSRLCSGLACHRVVRVFVGKIVLGDSLDGRSKAACRISMQHFVHRFRAVGNILSCNCC